MAKTVVGLMDGFSAARGVVDDLVAGGFDRGDIGLVSNEGQAPAANDSGESIGMLMRLGVPEDDAHQFAEGVRRGGTLITAHAGSDEQAGRAVEVMRRHGAVDIDERAADWRKQGWSGRFRSDDREAMPRSADERPVLTPEEARLARREAPAGGARVYSPGAEPTVEAIVALEEEEAAIVPPASYNGPERRVSSVPYDGVERRKAA